jgi:hypothetical protein
LRAFGQLGLVHAGDEDDPRLGAAHAEPSCRLQTVDLRHPHVDHRDLGVLCGRELDRRTAVLCRADDRQPLVVSEEKRQGICEQAVVVDDHHAHRSGFEISGHAL